VRAGFVAVPGSDGDKSPAKSGENSPHSKAHPRAARLWGCARSPTVLRVFGIRIIQIFNNAWHYPLTIRNDPPEKISILPIVALAADSARGEFRRARPVWEK
jgi:hypothetical protein